MKSFRQFLQENLSYVDFIEESIDFNSKTMKYVYYTLTTKHDSDKNIITDENGRKFEYYGSDRDGSMQAELFKEHIPFKRVILYNNNRPVQDNYEITSKQYNFLNMPYTHHKICGGINADDLNEEDDELIRVWVKQYNRRESYGNIGYETISKFLRYPSNESKTLHKTCTLHYLTKFLRNMDKLFTREDAKLKEPIVTRRYVDEEIFNSYHFKFGQIIKEPSYTATTTGTDIASHFSRGNPYHFKILIPEGTPCIKINNNGESEVLLPRKSVYEVVGIKGKGCGREDEVVLQLVHKKDDLIYGGNTTDTPAKMNKNDPIQIIKDGFKNNLPEEKIQQLIQNIPTGTKIYYHGDIGMGDASYMIKTDDGYTVHCKNGDEIEKIDVDNNFFSDNLELARQVFDR